MSGLYGGKGYFYQAIATVIHSIGEMDWSEVVMEPDNKRDKIDVVWHYSNGESKIAQIKSSKNVFTKPMILKVLSDLYNNSIGLQKIREYNLTLIGAFDQRANDLANKFIDKSVRVEDLGEYKELISIKDKISISKENDNYDFEGRIKLRLIEQSYEQFKYEDRNITAHSKELTYMFQSACANKKPITIEKFRNWIKPHQKLEYLEIDELLELSLRKVENFLNHFEKENFVSTKKTIQELIDVLNNKLDSTRYDSKLVNRGIRIKDGICLFVEHKEAVEYYKTHPQQNMIVIPRGARRILEILPIINEAYNEAVNQSNGIQGYTLKNIQEKYYNELNLFALETYLLELDSGNRQVRYIFEQLERYLTCGQIDIKVSYKERIQSIKNLIDTKGFVISRAAEPFRKDLLFTDGKFTFIEAIRVTDTLRKQRKENPSTIQLAIPGGANYLKVIIEIPLKIKDDMPVSQHPYSEDTLQEQSIIVFYKKLKEELNVKNYPYLNDKEEKNFSVLNVW
ncbi:hypothetical protein [Bacillus sp. Brlt_9]|uniref:hypothetical protein n=1 Tax=Bacillus sp. Brlt_9 TaxID=3110916 RepID=UPI003F7CA952